MEILVYDNQLAYYELLKSSFSEGIFFTLYKDSNFETIDKEYNMLVFFIYDELELLDFVRLYNKSIPVVLGLSQMDKENDLKIQGNIHYLHLNKLKNEIIENVQRVINTYVKQ